MSDQTSPSPSAEGSGEAATTEEASAPGPGPSQVGVDVALTFINQSNDANNSEVLVFAKNVAPSFEETSVAWTVIRNCGRG